MEGRGRVLCSVPAHQVSILKFACKIALAELIPSYMMLGMVIGDASHDLLLQKTATSICAFFLHAMSVFALAGIAGVNWQQRYFLLQLFR